MKNVDGIQNCVFSKQAAFGLRIYFAYKFFKRNGFRKKEFGDFLFVGLLKRDRGFDNPWGEGKRFDYCEDSRCHAKVFLKRFSKKSDFRSWKGGFPSLRYPSRTADPSLLFWADELICWTLVSPILSVHEKTCISLLSKRRCRSFFWGENLHFPFATILYHTPEKLSIVFSKKISVFLNFLYFFYNGLFRQRFGAGFFVFYKNVLMPQVYGKVFWFKSKNQKFKPIAGFVD